ncbi:hypothetical protein FXO37_22236 [Capsicum annuum]|nr:hypothetical protein FXO37_22236 [Capsicum annuum]
MRDGENMRERVEMESWIAGYISYLGNGTPWIERHDNLLTWDRSSLTVRMMVGLCDEANDPEVRGVDERVEVTMLAQNKMMKDLTYPNLPRRPHASTIVPSTQFEGPSISTEPIDLG